jgi:hypothetical protein
MCYKVNLHNNRLEAGVLLQNCIVFSSHAGFRSDATKYSDAWIHETTGFIGYDLLGISTNSFSIFCKIFCLDIRRHMIFFATKPNQYWEQR